MTNKEFSQFLENWFKSIMDLRERKRKEYASNQSAFENFEEASKLLGIPKENVALMYMTKHIISIYDIYKSNDKQKKKLLPEKINDSILYLLLMLAMETENEANSV